MKSTKGFLLQKHPCQIAEVISLRKDSVIVEEFYGNHEIKIIILL